MGMFQLIKLNIYQVYKNSVFIIPVLLFFFNVNQQALGASGIQQDIENAKIGLRRAENRVEAAREELQQCQLRATLSPPQCTSIELQFAEATLKATTTVRNDQSTFLDQLILEKTREDEQARVETERLRPETVKPTLEPPNNEGEEEVKKAKEKAETELAQAQKDINRFERKADAIEHNRRTGKGYEIDRPDAGGIGTAQGPDSLCKTSSALDSKYASCESTESLTETAQISNVVTQGVGAAATQAVGQSAQSQAAQQGTQSSALRGGASTAKTAGMAQMIGGVMNLGMGIAQLSASSDHKKNAREIEKELVKKHQFSVSQDSEIKRDIHTLKQAEGLEGAALDRNIFAPTGGGRGSSSGPAVQDNDINEGARGNQGSEHGFISTENTLTQKAIDEFSLQERGKLYGVNSTQDDFNKIDKKIIELRTQRDATIDLAQKAGFDSQLNRLRDQKTRMITERRKELELRGIKGVDDKKSDFNRQLNRIGNEGAGEQLATARKAKAGGFQSTVQGIGQMAQGLLNMQAAKELDKAAKKLEQVNSQGPVIVPRFNPRAFGGDPVAPRQATAISGSGELQEEEASEDGANKDDDDTLGPPIADIPKDKINGPLPEPGKFIPDVGGGGGGSNPTLGGGSTSASGNNAETDPSAKYADSIRNPGSYSGTGGGGSYTGGGGGSGGSPTNPEIDLSSLLGKLLPSAEDEKPKSILEFAGRTPASDEPYSLLDRHINIFQRIHDAYQVKSKKGQVGL